MNNDSQNVCNVGDVVLAPFPFADHSVTKLRPAIVISGLPNDAWLVIYVTSSLETETIFDVRLEPSKSNNLKVPSVARVNRLTVMAGSMISRQLGTLSQEEKTAIGEKLASLQTEFVGKQ